MAEKKPQIVSDLDHELEPKPLAEQGRAVRRQEIMVILANVGILAAGMGLGLPTVTMRQLTDPEEAVHLSTSQASWFASINTLSCPLGGLLSGFLLDRFGRKNTLYVLNILALAAWMLMTLAVQDDPDVVFIQLLVSRFVIGISTGLSSAPVGVYSAEISCPKIRSRLILGTSIAVAGGITFIYLLGYFIRDDWHLIGLISCGYQVVSIICLTPMPESPSWLISKNRINEAKASLNYFRGLEKTSIITHPEVLAEFNAMQKSIQLGVGEKKVSFVRSLHLPEVYKPLLILMSLFAFQQLTGIFVVVVYAVQIAADAHVSIDPFMCAVLVGVARVLTTFLMNIVLEAWGRRRAGMISALGMSVCMFLLAGHGWWEWVRSIPYLPVGAIVAFILMSTLGLYTLPFFMISELFPQKVRGPASGLTVAVGMFIAFLTLKSYPSMRSVIGNEYTFVAYGSMALAAFVFVYLCLPETRGRTLLEIEEQFRRGHKTKKSTSAADMEMQDQFLR